MAAQNPNDFVLLASYLTNQQSEKQNKTIRLLHDVLKGNKPSSDLNKNLELSITELKDLQLSEIKLLWAETTFPKQDVAHMIKVHNTFVNEAIEIENKRISDQAEHIRSEKILQRPTDVNAESLGISMSRRPLKKLPATHYTAENGASYGIDPQSGNRREYPLLYDSPITSLNEVNDILVYLPNSKLVDFRPSLENIIHRGRLLGFGERHYFTTFKLFVHEHFLQYATVLTGLTANEIFENLLVIFRSHDVATILKNSLRKFARQSTQSFTEYATILQSMAARTVAETHLQLSQTEAVEFSKDKILDYLTHFTSADCKKLFEHQRAIALRSDPQYYSYEGAVITLFKIETFVKPNPATYMIPTELYTSLTSDNSLTNSVMLQALQLSQLSQTSTPETTNDPSVFQTQTKPRSPSPHNTAQNYQQKQNNFQRSKPASSNRPLFRQGRSPSPHKDDQHRANPNYVSPQRPNFSGESRSNLPSRQYGPPNQLFRRNSQDRPGPQNRSSSGERSAYGQNKSRSPSRQFHQQSQGQTRADSREKPRTLSRDKSDQYNLQQSRDRPRSSSRDRQAQHDTRRPRDRQRSSSMGRQGRSASQGRGQDRSTSRGRDQYQDQRQQRSPSAGRRRYCPFCGKATCSPGVCNVFQKHELSYYPCNICPRDLYHRTNAHHLMNKN